MFPLSRNFIKGLHLIIHGVQNMAEISGNVSSLIIALHTPPVDYLFYRPSS